MDKKTIAAGALAGLIFAGGVVGSVSAQSAADATGLSEAQIIEIALAEVPGEVQETELEREDGVQVYEVEIMSAEGQEMEVKINANSGEVLDVAADGEGDRRGKSCDDKA